MMGITPGCLPKGQKSPVGIGRPFGHPDPLTQKPEDDHSEASPLTLSLLLFLLPANESLYLEFKSEKRSD